MFEFRVTRRAVAPLAVMVLALGAAACGGDDDDSASTEGGSGEGDGVTIALLLPESATARYETQDRPLFEAQVEELCPDCEIIYSNADQDAAEQQSQAEAALTNGADVLVLDPVDGASAGSIVSQAEAQDVPVLAYDRLIPDAPIDYYISYDNQRVGELQAPPLPEHLAAFAPAQLHRYRIPARKATALVRICRTFDPERLRRLPPDAAAARLERERGIGPYSVGVVWTQGLGRFDRGIVGDLGLLKVCSAIEGRWVEAEDTARILGRYEEWAGLACVYLMAGASRGLVPLKLTRPEVRRERVKARYAA